MWSPSARPVGSEFGPVARDPPEPGDAEWRILLALGYKADFLRSARVAASQWGLMLAEELIRSGHMDAGVWWQGVADHLSLRYYPNIYLPPVPVTASLPSFRRVRQALARMPGGPSILYIAPRGVEIDRLEATLAAEPALRPRYVIASPIAISQAIAESYGEAITLSAVERLRLSRPDMSASDAPAIKIRLMGVLTFGLLLLVVVPQIMILALNTVFLVLGGMRLASAYHRGHAGPPPLLSDAALPSYSVLVPLYREAAIVPSLAASLARIDYPRHKMAILIIVEADDLNTIAAVRKIGRGLAFRLLIVPPSLPRTKPKALCWALPFAEGELITIFDAEDRPAPDQLRLAAAAFASGDERLVCVQAALEVDHLPTSRSWISRQFALEYRVLFRSLLPWLAAKGLFLPLGGTSNHFRRSALLAVGAWDPFNVTEDADLAVRLTRLGGTIGVIASTTSEEAPLTWRQWHYQRTRWMKGWLQTSLVHFSDPLKLLRDLGLVRAGLVLILLPGQIAAAIAYPFGFLYMALEFCGVVPMFADRPFSGDIILALHLVAFAAGWLGAFMAIIRTARRQPGRMAVTASDLALVPVYWFLLFIAALAAPIELIRRPFRWNKTSHGLAVRRGDVGLPAVRAVGGKSVVRRLSDIGRRAVAGIARRDSSAP